MKKILLFLALALAFGMLSGCKKHDPMLSKKDKYVVSKYCGTSNASFYAHCFSGRRTASGERYNCHALTAAHRTLPFGTMVKVTSLCSGKSVIVRINDRGPHLRSRIIDLSYAAAKKISLVNMGVGKVKLEVVKKKR
jgi:rare lipoprotein A